MWNERALIRVGDSVKPGNDAAQHQREITLEGGVIEAHSIVKRTVSHFVRIAGGVGNYGEHK
jgi:hypothetical protein